MKIFKTYSIETDIIETFFMKYGKEINAHFKRDKQFQISTGHTRV